MHAVLQAATSNYGLRSHNPILRTQGGGTRPLGKLCEQVVLIGSLQFKLSSTRLRGLNCTSSELPLQQEESSPFRALRQIQLVTATHAKWLRDVVPRMTQSRVHRK